MFPSERQFILQRTNIALLCCECCRYFPFKDDRETVPKVDNQFIKQALKDGGMHTQLTQAVTQATQNGAFQDPDVIEIDSGDETPEIHAHPIFEIFWQVPPPVSYYSARNCCD